MPARLPLDKYAEGFVEECGRFGVDPEALVKMAQMWGYTGADVKPTGRSVKVTTTPARTSPLREARESLAGLDSIRALPGELARGHEAYQRETAGKNMGLGRRIGKAIKHYGGGVVQGILPTRRWGEELENIKATYHDIRGGMSKEYDKEREKMLADKAREESIQKGYKTLEEQKTEHARGRRDIQLQQEQAMSKYEMERQKAIRAGEDMEAWDEDNPSPKPVNTGWGAGRVRQAPLRRRWDPWATIGSPTL
jgi:hypothetical protein